MSVNRYKKALAAILSVMIICFTLFSFSAFAAEIERKGSISLNVRDNESGEPVVGVVFRLYRFADIAETENGIAYTYNDEFADCRMDMGNLTDSYLPVHLINYASERGIAYKEEVTDSNGNIVFSDLSCGAYLIFSGGLEDRYLKPSPFIVSVPMSPEGTNEWVYDIVASPKIETKSYESLGKTYISVKKQWQGSENHPDSVTVTLLKDGDAVGTAVLNKENNWYYRWDDLDKQHSWCVVESNVPKGYTVSYEASQMTVIITNTGTDTTVPPTTKPAESTTTPGGSTTAPGESTTAPEELIDTGQLNWPVPVFAIAGLLLFSVGWAMLNFAKKDEEEV